MRSITDVIDHFKQNWTEELSVPAITQACRDAGMTWNDSTLNPIATIQIFFLQILHGNTACEHLPHLACIPFTAAAYCKARIRVKLEVLCTLLERSVGQLQQETFKTGRWLGHLKTTILKTTMKMDILKCKTVDGVLRELQVFALIYNMVRQVMLEAANRQGVDVCRINFIDALRWLQTASPGDELPKLVVNPCRPNRLEPRVRKRRPKSYPLMTKPRRQLKKELMG